jgi:periplasmic protein TonB
MNAPSVHSASGTYLDKLLRHAEPPRARFLVAGLVALVGHLGLAAYAIERPAPPVISGPPFEAEFILPEPPPPEPEPLPEPPEAAPPAAAAPPTPHVAKLAAPPPAARAGAVMTAAADPALAQPTEPFDFTSDPNSHVYGSGVVAVGGTASHGLAGAELGGRGAEPVRALPRGDGLTPASDLSQKPRLREQDPCRGFFPRSARNDVALVAVRVVVGKHGQVASASVVSESPADQGFGAAARKCMLDQTFAPALDRAGLPAATAVSVNVRFSR